MPQVSLERRALEALGVSLPFGAPLDQALIFGPADSEATRSDGDGMFVYDAWGLELEWEEGRFVQAAYDLDVAGRDDALSPERLRGPDGEALTGETSKADVIRRFGEPGRTQELEGTTILYYHHAARPGTGGGPSGGALVSEFEFDEGRLSMWTVYVD